MDYVWLSPFSPLGLGFYIYIFIIYSYIFKRIPSKTTLPPSKTKTKQSKMAAASWSKVSQGSHRAKMIAEHQCTLSKLLWRPVGAKVTDTVLWFFKLTCQKTGREKEKHMAVAMGAWGVGETATHITGSLECEMLWWRGARHCLESW